MSCLQRVGGEALAAVWLLDCQSIASLNYHLRRHKCCLSNHEARGAQCRCTHHTAVCTLQYCTVPTGLTGSVEEMDSRGSNTSLGLNQRNRSEDSPGLRDSPPAQQNFRPIFRCRLVAPTVGTERDPTRRQWVVLHTLEVHGGAPVPAGRRDDARCTRCSVGAIEQ